MYFIYSVIANLIFLFSPIIFLFRIINGKEDYKRYQEKLCIYKKMNKLKSVWLHAASVGELMSIIPIIERLEKSFSVKQIILTTSTTSSAKIFKKQKLKKTIHKYYPLDTNYLTNKFIDIWKPQLAIFVESEIWPNMFKNLDKNKIPIIILNARITKKSFQRWKIFKNFSASIFSKISLALPSNLESQRFLKKLGVKNIKIAGNLKFYGKNIKINQNKFEFYRKFKKFTTWCAASTHEGEEILVAKLHKALKINNKTLLTIIIPRHINRSEKIITNLEKLNLNIVTYSSRNKIRKNTDIFLVDAYGEAANFYQLCKITFVGGSIVKHGGQNPLEPARLGNFILNGPNICNFKEIYAYLKKNKISVTTSNFNQMKKNIESKLNKNLSNKIKRKIFRIGNKILNKNTSYILKFI